MGKTQDELKQLQDARERKYTFIINKFKREKTFTANNPQDNTPLGENQETVNAGDLKKLQVILLSALFLVLVINISIFFAMKQKIDREAKVRKIISLRSSIVRRSAKPKSAPINQKPASEKVRR